MIDFDKFNTYKENNKLEVKKATGGLPHSIWETYSAFANTDGGLILLGVDENPDKTLNIVGLLNPEKLIADFWNIVNNSQKVSFNILFDRHVQIFEVENKRIIVIEVPRADRTLKPIYLNEKPYNETYRRNGEGDYHCSKEMVQAMIRDNGNKTQDMLVLDKMSFDVFDYDSVHRYRNRMKITRLGHVWEELEDIEFLQKLGAVGISEDDKKYPTAAGLLMFGFEYEIVREYPHYFLDYQEHFDASTRWTDRIISTSGEWSGNLYDFFYKTYNKLIQNPNIKIPFKIENGRDRIDDTPVHKTMREALANSLFNTDFYGTRGLVIRNNLNEIIFENPGGFRISLDEALSGGVSEPRNSVIMKMFNLLDIGERAGSGIPNIYKTWKEQNFGVPLYSELFEPDRTILKLPIKKVAIKSSDKKVAIKSSDKSETTKSKNQKNAVLEFAKQHGIIKSVDLLDVLNVGEQRIRKLLLELVIDGALISLGNNRNRTYKLPEQLNDLQ
ncbi:MAG: putative DNA binding domain-containing protein [Oscillospiraceae bacterium]|nr:putative DNA binding domain-containing protein [Oscillospiraceae bacterium]